MLLLDGSLALPEKTRMRVVLPKRWAAFAHFVAFHALLV